MRIRFLMTLFFGVILLAQQSEALPPGETLELAPLPPPAPVAPLPSGKISYRNYKGAPGSGHTYSGDLAEALDAVARQRDGDIRKFTDAADAYQKKIAEARAALGTETELDEAGQLRTKLSKERDAMEARIEELQRAARQQALSPEETKKNAAELVGLEKDLQLKSAAVAAERDKLQRSQADLEEAERKFAGLQYDLRRLSGDRRKEMADYRSEDFKQLRTSVLRNQKLEEMRDVTRELFDDVRYDYYKTGLLIRDFGDIQKDLKLDEDQLRAVKDVAAQKLNNTAIGEFVRRQVINAMVQSCTAPSFRQRCESGRNKDDVTALNGILEGILKNPVHPEVFANSSPDKAATAQPGGTAPRFNENLPTGVAVEPEPAAAAAE